MEASDRSKVTIVRMGDENVVEMCIYEGRRKVHEKCGCFVWKIRLFFFFLIKGTTLLMGVQKVFWVCLELFNIYLDGIGFTLKLKFG